MNYFQNLTGYGYETKNSKMIGKGSYGIIFQAYSLKLRIDVAIKQLDIQQIKQEKAIDSLNSEIQIMKKIKDKHIVQFIQFFSCNQFAYIVMQLCTNDLRKQLKRKSKFSEKQSIEIFQQIIKGVKVLTQNSYIHRDLKPQNILIKNGIYKISDFGLTKQADLNCRQKLSDICGTPIYMAPELLNKLPYTAKCDIWSLGMILYEMIYGSAPWPIKCLQSYKNAIKKRPLAFAFDIRIGKQTKDFLKRALVVDEQKRMSWKQLYEHPLIKNKVTGQVLKTEQMQFKVRKLLSKVQRETNRKFINIIEIFDRYSNKGDLQYTQFNNLLRELNPTISTHQIRLIFQACDRNGNGVIQKDEFKQMLCDVNYHQNPQIQKQIDEIIGIICTRQVEVKDLFEKFDNNKSGSLCLKQFRSMIKTIAPGYQIEMIDVVFSIIDKDKDGFITKKQFINCIGGGLVNQKHYVGLWFQKAARSMVTLKNYLLQLNLNPVEIVQLVDENKDDHLDIKQFTKLMQIIKFNINSDEILDIFKVLDHDCLRKISIIELENYME